MGELSLSFSLTALILSAPAYLLPFMRVELYGHGHDSTLWQGIVELASKGEWLVAGVIFLASFLVPIVKILILIWISLVYLGWVRPNEQLQHQKVQEVIEIIGRWSMLDVFLVAILVAMLKLGNLVQVSLGAGVIFFILVVVSTMLASECLNHVKGEGSK